MMSRKPISKKLRFDVLKRDSFRCQYCGSISPDAILEVDHIIPVASGGSNEIENLITSCFDCNRGKSKDPLTSIPKKLIDQTAEKKKRAKEYEEYMKAVTNEQRQIDAMINDVEVIYTASTDYVFSAGFRESVWKFIVSLGLSDVKSAMSVSCGRVKKPDDVLRYFCGICWNKIRKNDERSSVSTVF